MSQMNQENRHQYCVRFTGEMLPGFTQESAILSVAKAYDVPPEDIAKWFIAEGVTLRESANSEEVAQLEQFFSQYGLKLTITPQGSQDSQGTEQKNDTALGSKNEPLQDDTKSGIEAEAGTTATAKEYDLDSNKDSNDDKDANYGSKHDSSRLPENEGREVSLEELHKTLSQLKVMLLPQDLEGFTPAGLGKRLGAYLIDFFLFVILFQLILSNVLANLGLVNLDFLNDYIALFNASGGSLDEMLASPDIEGLALQILKSVGPWYIAFYFLYFSVQERYYGATIGKRMFKIRIFSLRTGKHLTWNSVAVRTILFFIGLQFLTSIPVVGIFLFLGTVLWATRDPLYRRTLYDMATATVVGSVPSDK